MKDLPFASEPAETAYQAGLKAGIEMTRDQFREALRAFVTAEEKSKRDYEAFRAKRTAECGESEPKTDHRSVPPQHHGWVG